MMEAADDRPFVHDPAAARQHVAEENAGDVGRVDAELAAVFDRGVGFGIPGIDMAGPAAHPQNDDGRLTCLPSRGLGPPFLTQQVGQCQSAAAEHTGLDETAPADADLLPEFFTTLTIHCPRHCRCLPKITGSQVIRPPFGRHSWLFHSCILWDRPDSANQKSGQAKISRWITATRGWELDHRAR